MEVYINGVCVRFLIDTGASVSVISRDIFDRIKDSASFQSLPVERGFKLRAASGHNISIIGMYQFFLTLLGRSIQRPLYVVEGITSSTAIFGIDFIREQQLVVAGDDLFFRCIPTPKWNALATLSAPERLHVPASTVMRSRLNVRDLHMNKLPVGTTGVAKPARDKLGVWEARECDWHGQISAVVVNTTDRDKYFDPNEALGFFDPITKEALNHGMSVDALLSQFVSEPIEKGEDFTPGKMSTTEMDHLNVSAPVEWRDKYIDLVKKYHDVCSKGKFDLGRTDVVEHKVTMKTEEPIHSRQFRIPLEHPQTCHDLRLPS